MVATALEALGVDMGAGDNVTREDIALAWELEHGDGPTGETLAMMIRERDERHVHWGFKRPGAFWLLPELLSRLRNPHVVIPFRDPVVIAKRNEISMQQPFEAALAAAVRDSTSLVQIAAQLDRPILMLSYEKALAEPEAFVGRLADFGGLSPRDGRRFRAVRSIRNGPEAYLLTSRVWYEGSLEELTATTAHGWARRQPRNEHCLVEIVSGGRVIGSGPTTSISPDGGTPTCEHVFHIQLTEEPQQNAYARVAGTIHVLTAMATSPT
jgi:hypothetical protein